MASATFKDVVDWFAAHQGQRAVVETGCSDPRGEQSADFPVLRVFTTLGEPYTANDPDREVGVLRVSFVNDDIERGGIQVQPDCLKSATIDAELLELWQHDVFITVALGRL